jgi:hypothetical protein
MQPALFADDPQFWYETQRVLGHAAYGGADTGEVLTTAQRITVGDYDRWHDEWLAIADRIADEAEAALKDGPPGQRTRRPAAGQQLLPRRRVLPAR